MIGASKVSSAKDKRRRVKLNPMPRTDSISSALPAAISAVLESISSAMHGRRLAIDHFLTLSNFFDAEATGFASAGNLKASTLSLHLRMPERDTRRIAPTELSSK